MTSLRMLFPFLALSAIGCGRASSAEPPSDRSAPPKEAVAIVNGVVVTDRDVRLRARSNEGHKEARDLGAAPRLDDVLETVIREELSAQRATELGLDKDPRYQEGLHQLEAQLIAYKRKGLSELFWERHVEKKAQPSEAEARAYFGQNEERIRTQLHVLQILRKSRQAIDEAKRQIDGGKRFEEVAASALPNLPPGETPWDLGYLSWYKLPEPWRPVVYDLKPGMVSKVIPGPNERYWIVLVVDRKEDAAIDFESVRAPILADLARRKIEEARENAGKELKARAKVERLRAPLPEPAHPNED